MYKISTRQDPLDNRIQYSFFFAIPLLTIKLGHVSAFILNHEHLKTTELPQALEVQEHPGQLPVQTKVSCENLTSQLF